MQPPQDVSNERNRKARSRTQITSESHATLLPWTWHTAASPRAAPFTVSPNNGLDQEISMIKPPLGETLSRP